jgi:integrase
MTDTVGAKRRRHFDDTEEDGMAGRRARTVKIQALIDRPGTAGEQQAAAAALERAGASRMPAVPIAREPLTDAVVRRLPQPAKGNRVYRDTALIGFGARVTAGGARAFVLDYRVRGSGLQRRFTIGQFPNWTTGAARQRARELRRLIDVGEDPLGTFKEARTAPTMAELAGRFEAEHLPRKRPGTRLAYLHILNLHIRPYFKHTKVADVDFADVDSLHRKVTIGAGPYAANRGLAVLSKMFSLAIRWGMRSGNPTQGIERNYEAERKRYLSGDELARLVKALAAHADRRAVDIIRLLLLTGSRKGEVLGMKWDDVDLDRGIWTKIGSTTKQRTDHIVPLSEPTLQLLKEIRTKSPADPSGFVFPADSATGHATDAKWAWTKIRRAAGISNLRIHDLRHSFASELASGGASLVMIGALLGHSDPATTARYAHLYDDPQRAAAEKVGAAITAAGKRRSRRPANDSERRNRGA